MINQIKVTYLDHMGSDKTVVNAARASFGKESKGPITKADVGLLNFLARGFDQKAWDELAGKVMMAQTLDDIKELLWLVKTTPTHFAPFTHPQLSLRIEAPLAIARQMWRSHVGLSGGDHGYPGWSEESKRYVDSVPDCFLPDVLRKRAEDVKQGSSEDVIDGNTMWLSYLNTQYEYGLYAYTAIIEAGIAPEQARLVLPQGAMVSWVWTGSLAAWARVAGLRSHTQAQKEAQYIAEPLIKILSERFPYSYQALSTGNAVFSGVELSSMEEGLAALGRGVQKIGQYEIGIGEIRFGERKPDVEEATFKDKFVDFFKKFFLLP